MTNQTDNTLDPHAVDVWQRAKAEQVGRLWSNIAGEPVTVEVIGGTYYTQCSELAAYRLEHKYNNRPTCEAFHSRGRESWMFRLEPRFADPLNWPV